MTHCLRAGLLLFLILSWCGAAFAGARASRGKTSGARAPAAKATAAKASGVKFSGDLSAQARLFSLPPGLPYQDMERAPLSFTSAVKLTAKSAARHTDFTFNPYFRYDSADSRRTVFDLHELNFGIGGNSWHAKAGYNVEFWGVMEFINPVNILNQADATEDFLGKRKLGQPMFDLTLLSRWGTLDLYALGFFQPMRFPGPGGRLRPPVPVRQDDALYASAAKRALPEAAFRYSKNIRSVSVALSGFHGYAREPEMLVRLDSQYAPYLLPRYYLQNQLGLELQVTLGNLILKSESVERLDEDWKHISRAAAIGGEYDFGALLNTGSNISFFSEYYSDQRRESLLAPFNNDIFAGLRLGLNDKRSTELKLWTNYDFYKHKTETLMFDANTRISDNLKAVAAYRGIVAATSPFDSAADDSHFWLRLEIYF